MGETDIYEHRIKQLESDVKTLYGKVNTSAISQAQTNIKLDNLLVTMGELKESISYIKNRPAAMWEKLVSGFIGAVAAGIAAAILAVILT